MGDRIDRGDVCKPQVVVLAQALWSRRANAYAKSVWVPVNKLGPPPG